MKRCAYVIRHYTREAGVRNLERTIGTVCRKQARRMAEGKNEQLIVTEAIIQEFLGGIKIRVEGEIEERTERPGVAVGLAWTPSGGDVLFVEANAMKGKGGFTMTGQIGQVMQESMQAALDLGPLERLRSWASLKTSSPITTFTCTCRRAPFRKTALRRRHHGNHAGLAADRHRIRPLTAMTGEITLSGNVLPIGGIKEKVLAAKRAGVTTIILPAENSMNVEEDLTPEQLANLSIHYVKTIEEALRVSLPVVAESLAAKVFMETDSDPKSDSKTDSKTKTPAIRPTQDPAVVHDRVVTAEA